jgi:hypothetical protein
MKKCKIGSGFYKNRQLYESTSMRKESVARNLTLGNFAMTTVDEKSS